ncbi:ATP-binding protein [bacterium]|nr:ATP-binding protein [bacterium]
MIEASTKIEILKTNNPFVSASTGDPWVNRFPDIQSINDKAYSLISRLIDQKLNNVQDGISCLILGEAGAGKTHLISRLLQRKIKDNSLFLFSYIQPIEDPHQTFRYLLREIAVSLCRPIKEDKIASQLDSLFGLFLLDLLGKKIKITSITRQEQKGLIQKLRQNPLSYLSSKILKSVLENPKFEQIARNYLMNTFSGIDRNFVNVFLKYRCIHHRSHSISWLKSVVLDERDCEELGVAKRIDMSERALEQEARDILNSIGMILGKYGRLLVVCFDRMENLNTLDHVHSFGKMLEFLVDHTYAMLPIAFFRGQLWEERFSHELNQHVVSRLHSNTAVLTGCDSSDALNIVKARLSFIFGEDIGDDFYPIDKQKLTQVFQSEILSPREIIFEANRVLNEILDNPIGDQFESVNSVLMNLLKREYANLKKNLKEIAPDRMRLRRTLGIYLNSIPQKSGFKVASVKVAKSEKEYIDCECVIDIEEKGETKIAFIIDDAQHHRAVDAKLRRGVEFLEDNLTNKVYYIRERRSKFPGAEVWKRTNKTLKEFKDKGGIDIRLSQSQAAFWYTLTFANYKIIDGEVTNYNDINGLQTVSEDRFLEFIANDLHDQQGLSFKDLDKAILKPRIDRLKRKRLEKLSVLQLYE